MGDEVDAMLATVRKRVTPDDEQRVALEAVATEVRQRAEAAVEELSVDAEVVQVGSTARNTWLPEDRDIDVFVCFPTELTRDELEAYGLEVGHAVLPNGREEYAEHPYVVGSVDGYDVDLVPCYAVESATAIESAVDRTPFHTRYVEDRLAAAEGSAETLADDIRVLKAFLTAIGVYGSDLKTRGFSGYLTELLVLEYGSSRAVLEAAANEWSPPVRIDPEDHGQQTFDDPLVVIDPTDPERNVAAVLHADSLARFQHHARAVLADPSEDQFTPTETAPLSDEAAEQFFADRATTPVAVVFAAPDIVDDQLWPQLWRSLAGIERELDRRGFAPLRSAAFAEDRAVLFVECAVAELPAVERHEGPPVHVGEHARSFYEKYAADEDVTGPYIEDGRYVVERERRFRTPEAFLASEAIFEVALGKTVEEALRAEYSVLSGRDVATLADEFGTQLAAYADPKP